MLSYLYALLAHLLLSSLNAQISPRALSSAGKTTHCREWYQAAEVLQQGERVKWAGMGWGRQDGMGQAALAGLEKQDPEPCVHPGRDTLGRAAEFPNFCTGEDALVLLPQQSHRRHMVSPRTQTQAWHQICENLWRIRSEFSQFSLKVPGKHRKCTHSFHLPTQTLSSRVLGLFSIRAAIPAVWF